MDPATLTYVIAYLDCFANSLIIPVMAPYLGMIGAAHVTIGTVMSTFVVLQLISSQFVTSLSSKVGPNTVLRLCLVVCCSCYFILGATASVPVVFACRAVLGLFDHTQKVCATLMSSTGPQPGQKWLATFGAFAFVYGCAIAGNMMEFRTGYQLTCYLITLIYIANLSITYLLLPPVPSEEEKKKKKKVASLQSLAKPVTELLQVDWARAWPVLALSFLVDFALAAHLSNFAPVLWQVYKTAPRWIGYTMAMQGLAMIASNYASGWLTQFYSEKNRSQKTLHGFSAYALSFVVLSLAPSWYFIVPCLLPLNISCALIRSDSSELLRRSNVSPSTAHTVGMAARIIAPVCTGLVYDCFGFGGTSLLRVMTSGAGAAIALSFINQKVTNKKQK